MRQESELFIIQYTVLIIGAGNIASKYDTKLTPGILTHAHAIICNPRLKLLGFVDVDKRNAKQAVEKWGGTAYSSLEEVAEMPDIICIATPDQFHYDNLIEALNIQPKCIIVEKPIVDQSFQVSLLRKRLESVRIPIIVNYSRRFLREFDNIRKKIAESEFGDLLCGNVYYGKGLVHNGSHLINLLLFLLGDMDVAHIEKGVADYKSDDLSYSMLLRLKDALVSMMCVDCRSITTFEMDLLFEKGRLRYIGSGDVIEVYNRMESTVYNGEIVYALADTIKVDYSRALIQLYNTVINTIENRNADSKSSLEDALKTLDICII